MTFLTAPGKITADTKVDLTANPLGFLARAANVWTSQAPLGQIQNQAYGYFFPHGAFFAAGQLLHVPPWIVQRVWWSLILFAGFWGLVRLAEACGVGSRGSRVVAATAFVLSPHVLTTLTAISSETAPVMLAPWVLIPLVKLLDGDGTAPRVLAARSAGAVALMGAVNAVATIAACAVSGLWWLAHLHFGHGSRRYWRFTAWWAGLLTLATLWWIVPLLIMGRVSPPFLDFIESSRATTAWTSLPESLRGTTSWSAFISSERTAGAMLVTTPAAVVTTGLVAAAGIAGLTMRRMPRRGLWMTVLLVGLVGIGLGYASSLGSPLAEPVRTFLDGAGAPLRNVYKLEPFLRLPLVLGIAHLLARAPLPGTVGLARARSSLAHLETNRLAAGALAVTLVIALSGALAWTGKAAPRNPYTQIPDYWSQTADWLAAHAAGVAPGQARAERALVVPGAPFGTQIWGLTRDEPIQPLAQTPWAVRDAIPLTPPGAIRAMDSVQRLLAAGTPAPGLAPTLLGQGIRFVVLRADLDPDTSRSARPALARAAVEGSPGLSEVATFGPPTAPKAVRDVVVDGGLRPPLPAITVYRVGTDTERQALPAGPYLADLDAMPRVAGGPESLLTLQDLAAAGGDPPLGPVLLSADARAAGLPAGTPTVTDTPKAREADFGRVDNNVSAIRAPGDPRRTLNRVPDYPVEGAPRVTGHWRGARISASSSASDATQLGTVLPGASPAAAVDGDPQTSWVSSGLDSAIGQWLQFDFPEPVTDLAADITVGRALGPEVTRLLITTDAGTTYSDAATAGRPLTVTAPSGPTRTLRITAVATADDSYGNQFALSDVALADTATGQPILVRHSVQVPPPPAPPARWVLGQDSMGRSGCVVTPGPDGGPGPVQCADIAVGPEEPGTFRRLVPSDGAEGLTPQLTLRSRTGAALAALLTAPGYPSSFADSSSADSRGNGYAATDGDPNTSWAAPQHATDPTAPAPVLALRLPSKQVVGGLDVSLPHGQAPARPTLLGIDLGNGRQVRKVPAGGDTVHLDLDPALTDRITVSVLGWADRININSLGFPEKMPPGLAELRATDASGRTVPGGRAAPDDRPIEIGCDDGPILTIGDQRRRFRIETTARDLRYHAPLTARACDRAPVKLPPGDQPVTVAPGPALSVQTLTLDRASAPVATALPTVAAPPILGWTADRRRIEVTAAHQDRVLVVPESVNPGWRATGPDGRELRAVTVDGWQQGWVIPAGTSGTITLRFALNAAYRIGLFGGLALLVVLAALIALPGNRGRRSPPRRPVRSPLLGGLGVVAAGFLLSGWVGAAAAAGCGIAMLLLAVAPGRPQRKASARVIAATAATTAGMLVLATAPWHAEGGYIGHDGLPQGLVLLGLLLAAWSTVPVWRAVARVRIRAARARSQRARATRHGSSTQA